MFIGVPYDPPLRVHPYAQNASEFPVFDAKLWYSGPSLGGPDNLGVIMPHKTAAARRSLGHNEALARIILTFRDAENVRWVRLPDGSFEQQAHPGVRDSVLAALGQSAPEPGAPELLEAAEAPEPSGDPAAPGPQ